MTTITAAEDAKWRNEIAAGDLADVRDDHGMWRLADVVEHRIDNVRVLPVGVDLMFAFWLGRDSQRIAMPRTRSAGDTPRVIANAPVAVPPPAANVAANVVAAPSAAVTSSVVASSAGAGTPVRPITPTQATTDREAAELRKFRNELNIGEYADIWDLALRRWRAAEIISATHQQFYYRAVDDHRTDMVSRGSERIQLPFTKSQARAASPPRLTSRAVGAPSSSSLVTGTPTVVPSVTAAAAVVAGSVGHHNHHHVPVVPNAGTAHDIQPGSGITDNHGNGSAHTVVAIPSHHAIIPGTNGSDNSIASSTSSIPSVTASSTAVATATGVIAGGTGAGVATATPTGGNGNDANSQAAAITWDPFKLKVGDKIDARDTESIWRHSEIMEVSPTHIYVHYTGWQPKWDEWIERRDSVRIKPAGSHARGFTGPPERAPRPVMTDLYTPYTPSVYESPSVPTYRSFECMSYCRWKRVLSANLSEKDITALSDLFDRTCRLQDDLQDYLLGTRPASELKTKVTELTKAIAETSAKVGRAGAFHIASCTTIVEGLANAARETEATARRQELTSTEEKYMRSLRDHFHMVDIPADGNCLFAATGRGHSMRSALDDCTSRDNVSLLVKDAQAIDRDLSLTIARDFRFQSVMHLKANDRYHGAIRTEITDALSNTDPNPTSRLLVNEMKAKFGAQVTAQQVDHQDAIDCYIKVMGQDGIYGTSLEVDALADYLKVPIHVYYRAGAASDVPLAAGVIPEAARIVGSHHSGVPLCLAFFMGNKHYNLLIARSPPKGDITPPIVSSTIGNTVIIATPTPTTSLSSISISESTGDAHVNNDGISSVNVPSSIPSSSSIPHIATPSSASAPAAATVPAPFPTATATVTATSATTVGHLTHTIPSSVSSVVSSSSSSGSGSDSMSVDMSSSMASSLASQIPSSSIVPTTL